MDPFRELLPQPQVTHEQSFELTNAGEVKEEQKMSMTKDLNVHYDQLRQNIVKENPYLSGDDIDSLLAMQIAQDIRNSRLGRLVAVSSQSIDKGSHSLVGDVYNERLLAGRVSAVDSDIIRSNQHRLMDTDWGDILKSLSEGIVRRTQAGKIVKDSGSLPKDLADAQALSTRVDLLWQLAKQQAERRLIEYSKNPAVLREVGQEQCNKQLTGIFYHTSSELFHVAELGNFALIKKDWQGTEYQTAKETFYCYFARGTRGYLNTFLAMRQMDNKFVEMERLAREKQLRGIFSEFPTFSFKN